MLRGDVSDFAAETTEAGTLVEDVVITRSGGVRLSSTMTLTTQPSKTGTSASPLIVWRETVQEESLLVLT